MDFSEKVVLVTGSSKGLGANLILKYAKMGANVIINYNNSYEDAIALNNSIKKYNVKSLIIKCDISHETEVKNMIDKIMLKFGKIDILVNNAGIAIDTIFENKTISNFKKTLDVNLIGTFLVSKYVGLIMMKQKYGKIINITSTNGIDTYFPYSIDYDASKAGIISLTHNLSVQFSPYVNVNAIVCGWMKTDMNKDLTKDYIDNECKKILVKRFGEVEEISNVVLFLSSDLASYVNNSIVRVDGGYYGNI